MGAKLRIRERAALAGSAFAAIVGAHALTYLLAAPGHDHRAELLRETGHGSWTNVFILAGAALIAALVALANRWASPRDRDAPPGRLLRIAWSRLVPLQIVGFIGLESAERIFAHGSPLEALTEPLVLWGIVVQAVAALVCGLLLVAFTHLVRRLRSCSARLTSESSTLDFIATQIFVLRSVSRRAWNVRGPPLSPRPC